MSTQGREPVGPVTPENWKRLSDEQDARRRAAGYFTIEEAASAIAEQEGWSDEQRKTLIRQMMGAALVGKLTVRHPHTNLPDRPAIVHGYYELVTRDDVNDWLGAHLRWNKASENTAAGRDDDVYRRFLRVALEDDAARLTDLQGSIELSPFPSKYWVSKAQRSGLLTPAQLLSMVGWVVLETTDEKPKHELYERWLRELAVAVLTGKIRAVDPVTMLPYTGNLSTWRWRLSIDDADAFLGERRILSATKILERLWAWNFQEHSDVACVEREQADGEPDRVTAGERGSITAGDDVAGGTGTTHRMGRRRDVLSPVIDGLIRTAADPSDRVSLWSALLAAAVRQDRPVPLLGVADGEVKYRGDDGEAAFLTRKAFMDRMRRRAATAR